MAWRVEGEEFHRLADPDNIAGRQAAVDPFNSWASLLVGKQLRTGRLNHRCVTANVVRVFVRVENLCDLPTIFLRASQALLVVERINRQRLTRFAAGDQVMEVSVGVSSPNLLDNHV